MSSIREHHFYCEGFSPDVGQHGWHARKTAVLTAPLGLSPEAPTCSTCFLRMVKDFGLPTVSFARKWRISMGR